jgi:hypothetical protein
MDYVLSGWGRLTQAGTQEIRIGAKNYGGSQVYQALTGTTYARATVPFTTGFENESARIFAWVPTQGGECFADDFRVRRAAAPMDAGFESGDLDAFWSPYGDTLVHSWSPVRSGGQAFRFNNPNADRGLEQEIVGLAPATAYRLSCWMRTDNQLMRLGVKNHGGADASTSRTATGNVWTRHEHPFTTGAANTGATLYAFIPAANRNNVVDVDDFFLAEPIPAGWTSTDLGSAVLQGESGRRGDRWILRAGGTDIWNTADSFRLLHSTLTGDGVIRARLRSMETSNTTAKFGIMLRSALTANAPHLYLGWRGDERMESIRRTSTGGASTADTTDAGDRVEWVRLHREGNTFHAATSANGLDWQPFGPPQVISMPATIYAGLAGTAADTADWVEGTADQFTVATNTAPSIGAIADLVVPENGSSGVIGFVVGDTETSAASLSLTATSTDPLLIPTAGVLFAGSGASRTVKLTPAAGTHGVALVTISVSDGTLSTSESFLLTVTPPSGGSITVAVTSSADDAEESSGGDVSLTSSDLELVTDGARGDQVVGMRFASVAIPAGAVITQARLQFRADEVQTGETWLAISGEAADSSAAFTAVSGNLSNRIATTLSVQWTPPAWNTVGESGTAQRSPNLAAVVQEIASRAGWTSGNALTLLVRGTGHRTADAFDKSGGVPPRLIVDYVIPQAITTLTKAIAVGADDAEESASGTVNLTSTDLELVNDTTNQTVGLRFGGIDIPGTAYIHGANLQFSADEVTTAAASLTIRAQAHDNAPAFAATASNLSGRSVTAASANWNPMAWNTIGETGAAQRSPDLTLLVREVLGRPGWTTGNSMAFLFTGTGRRTADAFDDTNAIPAVLTISYAAAPPETGYAKWLALHPQLAGSNADRTANPDRDGWSNLLEYALATDPTLPNAAPYVPGFEGGRITLTFQRPTVAPDVRYDMEWSDDLSNWSSAGTNQLVVGETGGVVSVLGSAPAGTGQRFIRILVRTAE